MLGLLNGILLPKLFWPTVRKNCSSDLEKLLKFEAEGREFANILRSLKRFIQTVKGKSNFWWQNTFLTCSGRFLIPNKLKELLEFRSMQEKFKKYYFSVLFASLLFILLQQKFVRSSEIINNSLTAKMFMICWGRPQNLDATSVAAVAPVDTSK